MQGIKHFFPRIAGKPPAVRGIFVLPVAGGTMRPQFSICKATPLAQSAGSNKIHWYGSATAGYKNSTYGIQTYGATFFTFYVGGACDITFTDTYDSGVTDTVYLYEAGNSTAVASQTLTGAVTNATNYTLSYEGTTPTVLRLRVPKNVYISTITVE